MSLKNLPKDEIANSITHGLATIAGFFGTVYYIYIGLKLGGLLQLFYLLLFAVSMILVYLFSTLYHLSELDGKWKLFFEKLDHSAIFLLIAGTYTPLMMFALGNTLGLIILTVNWCLALIGILLEISGMLKSRKLALIFYLSMGWLLIFALKSLIFDTPFFACVLLFGGAIFYNLGVFFYVKQKKLYFHAIWHIFVLLGSICHYFSILLLFFNLHK
jgi:hemolysin III